MNQVITIVTKDKVSILEKIRAIILKIIQNAGGTIQKNISLSTCAMDIMFLYDNKKIPELKNNIYENIKFYPVDFYIQDQFHRKKKLLACDMDMTILTFESIDRMADIAGINKKIKKETEQAVSGKSDFRNSIIKRTKMFKGKHKDICIKIFENQECFSPGSNILINTMRANSNFTILISGGYSLVADYVALTLGFDKVYANKLITSENIINGQLEEKIIDTNAKKTILVNTACELHIPLSDTLALGDGANDIEMLKTAGLGIGWNPQEKVKKISTTNIQHTDLKTVLYFQGYKEKDFVYDLNIN